IQGRHTWLLPDNSYPACRHFAGLEGVEYRYLFSIDGERFFLALTEEDLTPLGFVRHSARIFRHLEPMDRAYAGFTAQHLAGWYQANRFCGCCGSPNRRDGAERAMRCPECGNIVYPRINPAVVVALRHNGKLLLTHYADRVMLVRYALVAGFTEIGETLEDTVRREVMEEVGLPVKNVRYHASQPWGFAGNLMVGFWADLEGDDETVTLDTRELNEGVWLRREEIPENHSPIDLTHTMIELFRQGKDPQ
ncbi:MAG: NAD(+) diphosphatase, partial [Oscillospiraceae bacterium]|nr:NAD(+) diphosphatase [Oscillospiraceae bacterium]